MKRAVVAALLHAVLAAAAAAEASAGIYKCGPEGRQLQQQPCEGGRLAETRRSPTESERSAARAVARRDRELADRMERERLRREQADLQRNSGAGNLGPAARSQPDKPSQARTGKASSPGKSSAAPKVIGPAPPKPQKDTKKKGA